MGAAAGFRRYTEGMNKHSEFAMAAALLWTAAGCAPFSRAGGEAGLDAASRRDLAERVSSGWSEAPRLAARLMMSRYGPPDVVGISRLIWHGNGPWKRTIVRDLPRGYARAGDEDLGVLEQTVAYNLTREQAEALRPFSGRLTLDPTSMEMSSRSDREEINCLRLNLANDVARGSLGADEARKVFARSMALDVSGKTASGMSCLIFGPGIVRTP